MTPRSAWLQALLPLAAPVPVAALAAAVGVLSTNAMVAVAIAAAICLSGRSAAELLRAQHQRDDADRWILGHAGARPDDDLIDGTHPRAGRPTDADDPRIDAPPDRDRGDHSVPDLSHPGLGQPP